MSPAGALLGLFAGCALLLVILRLPRLRRMVLADRVDPYLIDAMPAVRRPRPSTSPSTAATIFRPWIESCAVRIDRVVGGRSSVEQRLLQAGRSPDVAAFRASQVTWTALGAGLGFVLLVARLVAGLGPAIPADLALTVLLAGCGAYGRDSWLSYEVKVRARALAGELPVMAELLALAVTAGEGPVGALERVTRRSRGALADELRIALSEARTGATLVEALDGVAVRTRMVALERFVSGIVISIERGTPLAEVLRAQAADAREAAKRDLIESGGRREIAMLVPIVFIILPVIVLFALYPGFVQFTIVTK